MNKRYWLLGVLLGFLAAPLMAQQAPLPTSGRIVGMVTAEAGPLIAAQVTLRAATDSVVARTSTAPDGRFMLDKVPFGRYSLGVNYLGYKDRLIPNVAVTAASPLVELGAIKLEQQIIALIETVAALAL